MYRCAYLANLEGAVSVSNRLFQAPKQDIGPFEFRVEHRCFAGARHLDNMIGNFARSARNADNSSESATVSAASDVLAQSGTTADANGIMRTTT
ncbi:hypothetical protein S4A8_10431 [Salinisphaera sp. S4-8]|uniref:hypothetical protein n=1 Tax=Salinisphaera sp. S4-8 TaxID=633357 RepID=UPI00334084FA